MNTKLTLSVEKQIIEKAKSYARRTGRSLSELVSAYFESLTDNEKGPTKISPKLKKLVGSVKLPKNLTRKMKGEVTLETNIHEIHFH